MAFYKKKVDSGVYDTCMCRESNVFIPADGFAESVAKPALLLHSCCGPCSTTVVERLVDEFDITVFFYNPCITDEEEYQRRKISQIKFIEEFNRENAGKVVIRFKEGDYRPSEFFKLTKGLENEPEGGERCKVCFRHRLEKTSEMSVITGNEYFGTTLTVSPHKNYKLISQIGNEIAMKYGNTFLDRDFKKKDGFKRSVELSKKYGLYRQNYCGCEYSKQLGDD